MSRLTLRTPRRRVRLRLPPIRSRPTRVEEPEIAYAGSPRPAADGSSISP